MKKINDKKAISLIVLVITIIVMIILATVIILSIQSSDIIGKANKAKSDANASNIKEAAAIASSEWELMTAAEKAGMTYEEYMKEKMEPLVGDKIDEWIVMNVKLKDLTDIGYIVSEVDGTVYLTGLDSDVKKSVETVTAKGYKVKDLDSGWVDAGNMSTEYKIYKGEEELATVVYFGEVDGIVTSLDIGDASVILNACIGAAEIKPYMDLNHDGILSVGDSIVVQSVLAGYLNVDEQQNIEVNKITKVIEGSKSMNQKEIIEMLEIHSGEITYNETDGFYYLTLKKSYTYKELNDELKSKYGCSLTYRGESFISNKSTDIIESGIKVQTGAIYYEKIVGNTSYNYSTGVSFKTN